MTGLSSVLTKLSLSLLGLGGEYSTAVLYVQLGLGVRVLPQSVRADAAKRTRQVRSETLDARWTESAQHSLWSTAEWGSWFAELK
jgi:hypothetical protein